MKKSWKTSAGGIATILAGLSAAIVLYQQGNVSEAIATAVAAVSTGFGLISARDEKVTSHDAGVVNKPPPDKTP
jgi:hypothetical protein